MKKLTASEPSWLQIDVERLLFVDRGRDTILLDRTRELLGAHGGTILVKPTPSGRKALQEG